MKRVTGVTNNPSATSEVSIRLMLDGLSFSEEQLVALPRDGRRAEVVLLTAKTMLVPRELCPERETAQIMRLNGMEPTSRETVLRIEDARQGMVALLAVDRETVERIRSAKGRNLRWNTPLLYEPENAGALLWVRREEKLVYMKCWSDRLLLAEVLVVPTAEDLLFFVTEFLREAALRPDTIRVEGTAARQDARLLREYFKHVIVCE